jgi:hypothetical protein
VPVLEVESSIPSSESIHLPQMTIFECQKDKKMTRVKNKVINVKVILEFIS